MGGPVIHIIDDVQDIRDLAAELLGGVYMECVLWESPAKFLAEAQNWAIDVLVVDVRLSGMSGLEMVRRLREAGVWAPVVFMSGYNEVPVAVEAMKLGAIDFLSKPFRSQELIDAVQAALRKSTQQREHDTVVAEQKRLVARLSPRELQIFEGVIAGKPNKVLAIELGLSEKTVEDHRARMLAKLGATSVADLVKIGVLAGLCDPATERAPG